MANPQIGIIMFENKALTAVPTTGAFGTLRNNYRFYPNWHATSSPSLPDYCAISSGSWLGKAGSDGGTVGFAGTHSNIFHAVENLGFSWKCYEEGVSAGGGGYVTWRTASNNGTTKYLSRHCPGAFYTNTDAQPVDNPGVNGRFDFSGSNGLIADIAASRLPDLFFITPNSNNDAHDASAAFANQWLGGGNPDGNPYTFLGITDLISHMRPGGLVVVTFDNPGSSPTPPIYTVIAGPGVTSQTINTNYTHFSLVLGIGDVFGFSKFTDSSLGGQAAGYTNGVAVPLPPGGTGTIDTIPPTKPTNVAAVANSPTSVTVSWTASTDNVGVTGYTVYRNGTAVGTPLASPFTNTGLTASTTYSYTVSAHDAVPLDSGQSTAATVTTPANPDTTPPTTPTNLVASNITSSSATITWTPSTDSGGSGLAGYDVFRDGGQVASVTSPTYPATGLTASTTYSFTVKARDGGGLLSSASSPVSVTTLAIVTGGSVQFRATTDFNSGTTSVAVNPAHATNGDTMFAHATAVGASAITPPSGWTLVGATNDSTAISTSVYMKTASSETTATWTCAGATSLTVEISYVIGPCSVRVSGTNHSTGTAVVLNTGSSLSGLQVNDEVCTWISSNAGPRPYPDSGCTFGFMTPHDWTSQAQVTTVENSVQRKIALAHHQVPWDCHVGATHGDFSASTQAPRVDYNNNRITYISWPRQLAGTDTSESSWNSVFGNGDPLSVFQGIQAGTYDTIIDNNATAYQTAGLATGAHYIIRLFWEMNGGGVIFTIGKTANFAAYQAAYNPACQRIITRTKAIAKNVSFHWNPQNFQTTSISRDQLYWGDSYADFVGTELYTGANNITTMMTQTNAGNGSPNYPAIYSGYGPGSSHNKLLIAGEGGPQANHGGTESDATVAARVQDYIDAIPNFPGLRQFTWWNGSGNGTTDDSIITDQGPLTLAKIRTMVGSSYFSPQLTRTWKAVT